MRGSPVPVETRVISRLERDGSARRMRGHQARNVGDGHVVEAGALVGGEDDACAAHCEEAHEGKGAAEKIAAGVVDEEDGLAMGWSGEDAVRQRVVLVDEPGAGV